MKHTKGPWITDIRTGVIKIYPESEGKHNCLSGVKGIVTFIGEGEESQSNGYRYVTDEQIANAKLIGVVPEMFDVLEMLEKVFHLANVSGDDNEACIEWLDSQDQLEQMMKKVLDKIRK